MQTTSRHITTILAMTAMTLTAAIATTSAADHKTIRTEERTPRTTHTRRDTTDTIAVRRRQEVGNMRTTMTQSAYPVSIRIVGTALCVNSKYNQVLPVYTEGGSFYAAFRVIKGNNWISALPQGTYFINNRRIEVP